MVARFCTIKQLFSLPKIYKINGKNPVKTRHFNGLKKEKELIAQLFSFFKILFIIKIRLLNVNY